jgi:carbonic anhydrase/acetyltransferase-like protein (isoleucine patch superfamily)
MIHALGTRRPERQGQTWIADNATVIGSVLLEDGASVWFNCVVRGDMDLITIGARSNVQDGSVLHTDHGVPLRIGADCTIGHMVMLHGCEIGDNTLIGIKSVILNRARIGRDCIVGANSLITEGKQFPDGVLIMGAPAKVVRPLTPQEIQFNTLSAQHYVQNAQHFSRELQAL